MPKPQILGIERPENHSGNDPWDCQTGWDLCKHFGVETVQEMRRYFMLNDLFNTIPVDDFQLAVQRFQTSWEWLSDVVVLMGEEVKRCFECSYEVELEQYVFKKVRVNNQRIIEVASIPHLSRKNKSFNRYDVARVSTVLKQAVELANPSY